VCVWLLAKAKPLLDYIWTVASSLGLPSTRKTLTDWSKSYRDQNYSWGLEHIMDKGRQRELSF